jgi:peptide/nickel transport system permease protein
VLRNALLPLVTYTGLQAGNLVGGTVLIETVFAIPGLGRLTYDAILTRDYMLLLGILIVTSVLVILVNLVTDILYTIVEPRVELS